MERVLRRGLGALIVVIAAGMVVISTVELVFGATTRKVYWVSPLGESGYDIKLVKMADVWADPDNTLGVYEGDSLYSFTVDLETFATVDGSSLYQIMENGTAVIEYLDIGTAKSVNDTLRAHRLTGQNVHGLAGGANVVGDITADTLTNKRIDGDDNTLADIPGSAIKVDAVLPQHSVRPNAGVDTYGFWTATADAVTFQASNAAKNDDDSLVVIAEKIRLQNDAGSAITVAGLAAGTVNGDAVRYEQWADHEARLDALERDDVFSVGSAVSLTLFVPGAANQVRAAFNMNPVSDQDSVRYFDIFYSTEALQGLAAGVLDAAELSYLQQHASRARVDAFGRFGSYTIVCYSQVWVVAVAYDWVGTILNSDIETATPEDGGLHRLGRDADGAVLNLTFPAFSSMAVAYADTDSVAAAFNEQEQQGTDSRTAYRFSYRYQASHRTLRVTLYARVDAGTGNEGYVQVAVTNGASDVASVTYGVVLASASYSATPDVIDLNLSGLSSGVVYNLEVREWAKGSGYSVFIRGDVVGEVVSQISVY